MRSAHLARVPVFYEVCEVIVTVQAPKEARGSRSALRIAPGAAEDEKTAQDAVQAAEVGLQFNSLSCLDIFTPRHIEPHLLHI